MTEGPWRTVLEDQLADIRDWSTSPCLNRCHKKLMRPELSSSRLSPGTVSVQAFNIPGASWPWAEAIFGLILLVAALVALLGWTEKAVEEKGPV